MYYSGFSREVEPKEIYYKELSHIMMEAEKSHFAICRLETQESQWNISVHVWTRGANSVNSSLSLKTWKPGASRAKEDWCPSLRNQAERTKLFLCLFVLFRPLVNCMTATHVGEVNCSVESTDSNANFIQKHSHRHTQIWYLAKYLGIWLSPVNLTHKIRYHSGCS